MIQYHNYHMMTISPYTSSYHQSLLSPLSIYTSHPTRCLIRVNKTNNKSYWKNEDIAGCEAKRENKLSCVSLITKTIYTKAFRTNIGLF